MATIRRVFEHILGRKPDRCPSWPPDLFAAVATVLSRSGVYLRAIEIGDDALLDETWPAECRTVGAEWREVIDGTSVDQLAAGTLAPPPKPVRSVWLRLIRQYGRAELATLTTEPVELMLKLVGFCDEASVGMGLGSDLSTPFHFIEELARGGNDHRSSCIEVDTAHARVLPKQHTPQRGATLRSLTHHLALAPFLEVDARWFKPREPKRRVDDHRLNVLCLPWPLTIDRGDFEVVESGVRTMDARFHRFFRLRRASTRMQRREFANYLARALEDALTDCDGVDLLVLPELALDTGLLDVLRRFAHRHNVLAVTGVALEKGEALDAIEGPTNVSVFLESDRAWVQRKHHRWCLEGSQIVQYGLAGRLPSSIDLWEHISLGRRDALFHTLSPWLTFTTLICEDLARQDPMAATIRAIGPNLVFALLMDGPQLRHRWGPRYATALAEDPGSSVLVLTSLGMAQLSSPREEGRESRTRVVGLWKDVRRDVELQLEPGQSAILLNLEREARTEFTLDGRNDGQVSYFPILRSFRGVRTDV